MKSAGEGNKIWAERQLRPTKLSGTFNHTAATVGRDHSRENEVVTSEEMIHGSRCPNGRSRIICSTLLVLSEMV
jgi:hypothetical protein